MIAEGIPLMPRITVSVGLGWGSKFCNSKKFSGDAAAARVGTPL